MARRPTLRAALRFTALGLGLVVALLASASLYVERRYQGRMVSPADAPPSEVALVFGAGLARGEPSPLLAERLDMAVALYRQGKVKRILVSGDNSDRYHDETEAMRRYAVEQGVPPADLLEDDLGLSTYDSCARAREVFRLDRVLLVTQRFHLPRALFIANSIGLDAHGVPADPGGRGGSPYALRELLSRPLALGMVLVRPRPAGDDRRAP
ncbi:MAG TPA: ElyC/SanA/YdcF family protein [Myxococcales bacterium]|nr:ElyC/SanA/YdcF family protein [Myxococcales bacterium]